MRSRDQWAADLRGSVCIVAQDPGYIGVKSMGERCAIALVLELDSLRPHGYTWLDCANRLEPELLEACVILQRERARA